MRLVQRVAIRRLAQGRCVERFGGTKQPPPLHGQLAELLLLPTSTGTEVASDVASVLRFRPSLSLHEAATRCGLRPTLSLSPGALLLHGGSAVLSTDQLGAVEGGSGERGVPIRRPIDARERLVSSGGVRVPLLLAKYGGAS